MLLKTSSEYKMNNYLNGIFVVFITAVAVLYLIG